MAGNSNQVNSAAQFAFNQLPSDLQRRQMDPFIYEVDVLNAPAASTSTASLSINNDADFLVISLVGRVTTTDFSAEIAFPPATLLITDSGSGRAISNVSVLWQNTVGTALQPYYLDYPKYLARGTTVTVQYTNLAAATAHCMRLAFRGFKIFSTLAASS
jgi:hypothetical protein